MPTSIIILADSGWVSIRRKIIAYSTTSRFFPGTERQDGVRARLARKGAGIQASLASPAAGAEPIR